MQNKISYQCKLCNKKYLKHACFIRHELLCQILNTPENDLKSNMNLSLQNLGIIVVDLIKSNERLKQEVSEMKNWVKLRKKKIMVIDWLNENNKNNSDYKIFKEQIQLTEDDLNLIFKYDLIDGLSKILMNRFELEKKNQKSIPFKAFDQKENVIYIFDNNRWIIWDNEMYSDFFQYLTRKYMEQFSTWQEKNESRLYNEDFSTIYINNVRKIIGGSIPIDKQKIIIHRFIYNSLKENLQNIIEYEFS